MRVVVLLLLLVFENLASFFRATVLDRSLTAKAFVINGDSGLVDALTI